MVFYGIKSYKPSEYGGNSASYNASNLNYSMMNSYFTQPYAQKQNIIYNMKPSSASCYNDCGKAIIS